MPLEKHDLLHELPEYKNLIHDLKVGNRHFSKIFAEYHDVDHEIRRFETGTESCEDAHLDGRKRARLRLKDELLVMLKKAS